ncbi:MULTISPECIES: hypothetical protein [unclassified Microbacterium]|uniref:hypothetical protein n=1 Tax=unclassified Microbacterium TaxID=2609290 RepID=UPI00301AC742
MKPARLLLLIFAVGMVPFALASYNGATLLGVAAITAFIALTIVGAPRKDRQS